MQRPKALLGSMKVRVRKLDARIRRRSSLEPIQIIGKISPYPKGRGAAG